jgi:hypothetical protein
MQREVDPKVYARVGGVLYLIIIALGLTEELFIRGRVKVPGDAAATFANLREMETLWRIGIAAELVMMMASIALSVVLYVLIRRVHQELALLALVTNAVAIAVESAYAIQLLEALFPLGKSAYLSAFTPAQLEAMTALSMKSHVFGFGIALLLFGCFCLLMGYLLYTSRYFPKLLGVLFQLGGVAYLVNGFVLVLVPRLAGRAFPLMGLAFIAETSFALWLLFRGVRVEKWPAKDSSLLAA